MAGKLHIGRSRNDMDHTIFKIVLRNRIDELTGSGLNLARTLNDKARQHLSTIIVAYTHGQPAQPTTLGHYLAAVLDVLLSDLDRLAAARRLVDRCPMGAAAITTTGFPIDRERMARLLGFAEPTSNSYASIAAVDYLTASYAAIRLLMLHLGRFAQDLQFWSSFEVGQAAFEDGLVQISSIMPQKRNPVAIEHARLLGSLASGQAETIVAAMHNTPFTDMNDSEGPVQAAGYAAFDNAGRMLDLLSALVAAMAIDEARVAANIERSGITLTELADTLVRDEGLSFRQAHGIVAQLARTLGDTNRTIGDGGYEVASEAFKTETGRTLSLSPEAFAKTVSAAPFVAVRDRVGGPAATVLARALEDYESKIATFQQATVDRRRHAEAGEAELDRVFAQLSSDQPGRE